MPAGGRAIAPCAIFGKSVPRHSRYKRYAGAECKREPLPALREAQPAINVAMAWQCCLRRARGNPQIHDSLRKTSRDRDAIATDGRHARKARNAETQRGCSRCVGVCGEISCLAERIGRHFGFRANHGLGGDVAGHLVVVSHGDDVVAGAVGGASLSSHSGAAAISSS